MPDRGAKDAQPPAAARARLTTALRRRARPLKRLLREGEARLASSVGPLFTRSEALSGLYYAAAPAIFGREHRAVLAGKIRYEQLRDGGRQRYLLRRNTHMLEKGLSMRPRRDVFALDYIEETVACFHAAIGEDGGAAETDRETQWANDVLASYFEVTGDHPVIDRARRSFIAAPLGTDPRVSKPGLSPYRRDLTNPAPVEYDDLLALAERRRSVRWFEPRPVPRELIERALLVAALSPSACNRQPFQFRIFDDPETVQRVAAVPMGTKGWSHNVPAFVVVVGSLSAFFSERDRHLIYTDGSLAIMSFILALESLGLSTCCVNWPDIAERERRMAHLLKLDRSERPIMCIAIGFPDPEGFVPFSHKKPAPEIGRWNFE